MRKHSKVTGINTKASAPARTRNYNFECDWLFQTTSLNVIDFLNCPITNCPITNYPIINYPITTWQRISGKQDFFKPITREEIVIFFIRALISPWRGELFCKEDSFINTIKKATKFAS